MIGWFERATPYIHIHPFNPVFDYEIRRIRWGRSQHHLIGYSLAVLWLIPFFVLALWILLLDNPHPAAFDPRDKFITLLLIAGIGANLMLDMVSLTAALHSISGDMRSGHWDVLRLTSVGTDRLVAAKYAIAQVRAWRVMILVISLRISLIVFLLIRIELLPTTLVLAGYLLAYVIEPLWRMQALTAVGVVIAVRIRNLTSALCAAFGVMLAVWAVQGIIIVIILDWLEASVPALVCFEPLILLAAGWMFYALCRGLRRVALRDAVSHAFVSD